jgi:hypothetical protein
MAYEDLSNEQHTPLLSQAARAEQSQALAQIAMLHEQAGSGYVHLPASMTLHQLMTTLRAQTWQARVATARLLGETGGPEAIATLCELLTHDEVSSVRAAAARALGKQRARTAEPFFLTALEHDSADEVRTAVAQALGTLGTHLSDGALDALTESFYAEIHAETRAAVLLALSASGQRTPIATLQFALADPAWTVREAAALAMGEQGTHADEAALEAALDDEVEPVCKAAVYALGKIGAQSSPLLQAGPAPVIVQDTSRQGHAPESGSGTCVPPTEGLSQDLVQKKTAEREARRRIHGDIAFYAYESAELSGTKVIAQALDNQWIPQTLMRAMIKGRISSKDAEQYLRRLVRAEYIRSLINSERVIINRAYLYNNEVLSGDYAQPGPAREACKRLLEQGVIIPWLLYETSPDQQPDFAVLPQSFPVWQQLCTEVAMHCVRFSWDEPLHQQLQLAFTRDFQEFVESLYDKDSQKLLTDLHVPPDVGEAFFQRLNEMNHVSHGFYLKHRGEARPHITRNALYEHFVTQGNPAERHYDGSKPFAGEIKQILDLIYNAHQADVFNGYLLTPLDSPDRHTLQEWDPRRFRNARSFDADALITMLRGSAFSLVQEGLYLRSMDLLTLQDILDMRSTQVWRAYITSLQALLQQPVLFSTLAENVYSQYVALAREMTHLIELRQRHAGGVLTAPWEPSVKMRIDVGAASQEVIWNRDGTFHPGTDASPVRRALDGSAPVTVRWTIGDSGASRAGNQAKLFSSIDIVQGRMPDAQREWQKLLKELGKALQSREFSPGPEPKREVPTLNGRPC